MTVFPSYFARLSFQFYFFFFIFTSRVRLKHLHIIIMIISITTHAHIKVKKRCSVTVQKVCHMSAVEPCLRLKKCITSQIEFGLFKNSSLNRCHFPIFPI